MSEPKRKPLPAAGIRPCRTNSEGRASTGLRRGDVNAAPPHPCDCRQSGLPNCATRLRDLLPVYGRIHSARDAASWQPGASDAAQMIALDTTSRSRLARFTGVSAIDWSRIGSLISRRDDCQFDQTPLLVRSGVRVRVKHTRASRRRMSTLAPRVLVAHELCGRSMLCSLRQPSHSACSVR